MSSRIVLALTLCFLSGATDKPEGSAKPASKLWAGISVNYPVFHPTEDSATRGGLVRVWERNFNAPY